MAQQVRSVTWEAPEHHHVEKGGDWFWILWIIAVAGATAAFFFGNFLLALLIVIAATAVSLLANREPAIVEYGVTPRGLRMDSVLYPYSTLESFYLDEDHPLGPQLLAKSQKMFAPLIVMPVPLEYIDDIEDIIAERLPEEHLEEPFATKLLEFFGF